MTKNNSGKDFLCTTEITENWCADTSLEMAIIQIAKDDNISRDEALDRFKQTRVYNALYDFDTGMWGEGPASLIHLYREFREDCIDDQKGGVAQ